MNWKKISLVFSLLLFLCSYGFASSSAEWTFYWFVGADSTPPTVKIFRPIANDWNAGTLYIDVSVVDNNAIKSAWLDFNYTYTDQNLTIGDNNKNIDTTSAALSVYDLNITAYAYDYNSQNLPGYDEVIVKIDNLSPDLNITTPFDNSSSSSNTITFDVNDADSQIDSSTIRVDINGVTSTAFAFASHCTDADSDGNYICTYTETTIFTNADYNIQVVAKDTVGNEGVDEVIFSYTGAAAGDTFFILFGGSSTTMVLIGVFIAIAVSVGIVFFYLKRKEGLEEGIEELEDV